MKIGELFQRDIGRTIEEVIKVDQADEKVVRNEIEEYIATDSIKSHYIKVLEAYNQARTQPTEGIGIWVSGFFGSGKSSFAKNLGYILSAKSLLGENASEIFSRQTQNSKITDLLKIINSTIPTDAVVFDVSMERGVRTANERITEVMYKALLRELGYADDFDLAALEMDLEQSGELAKFIELYNGEFPQPWETGRKRARSISQASKILHLMDGNTYSEADSWAKSLAGGRADISANILADRAFELMNRRRKGKALIFVIDEVGQYVSRSVDKMLDLQALIQAFGVIGKNRVTTGKSATPIWIIVTSQEKLNEVVDALEGKKTELARLQDRFAIHVDLAPEDISEVASKRVLQKNPQGETKLKELYDKNEGRLNTLCHLEQTSRNSSVSKKAFVELYPYLPHHIDLCIDIVSGIRLQPGAMRHIGGSNRTIIKQAQEMLINENTNLAKQEIGKLVTMDLVYNLVEGNLSTERRKDISDIARTFSGKPFYAKVGKVICLLGFFAYPPMCINLRILCNC